MALWSLSLMTLSQSTTVMSMKAQAQCTSDQGFIGEFCNEAQSRQYWAAPTSWRIDHYNQDKGRPGQAGHRRRIQLVWLLVLFTKKRGSFMQAPETYAPLLSGFCPFALTGSDAKMPQRSLSVKDLKAMGGSRPVAHSMMIGYWCFGGPKRCGCSGGTLRVTWRKRRTIGRC